MVFTVQVYLARSDGLFSFPPPVFFVFLDKRSELPCFCIQANSAICKASKERVGKGKDTSLVGK